MALSVGAYITGQLITQLALYKLEIPGKVPKTKISLITGTEQHENANYWYRTTQKHSVICTGVVALESPAARTINYHLLCFTLIWQFST